MSVDVLKQCSGEAALTACFYTCLISSTCVMAEVVLCSSSNHWQLLARGKALNRSQEKIRRVKLKSGTLKLVRRKGDVMVGGVERCSGEMQDFFYPLIVPSRAPPVFITKQGLGYLFSTIAPGPDLAWRQHLIIIY